MSSLGLHWAALCKSVGRLTPRPSYAALRQTRRSQWLLYCTASALFLLTLRQSSSALITAAASIVWSIPLLRFLVSSCSACGPPLVWRFMAGFFDLSRVWIHFEPFCSQSSSNEDSRQDEQ